jgi:hypothetical protein
LKAAAGESLSFSLIGGGIFNVIAVDLAEYSTVVPDPRTVSFYGFRSDGSTVRADFTTDGIIEGPGPIADFETFYFGPEFSGLTRVDIPTIGWSLDNLVISIPEPASSVLLLTGGLLLIRWSRRLNRAIKPPRE